MMAPPHIAILLATYNGADFILDQLNSYKDQTHKNWSLWISDDGSTDATTDIVAQFINDHPTLKIHQLEGPKQGSIANFMSLMCHPLPTGDYFALSDQDDVWFADKLTRACGAIDNAHGPMLYGTRTRIVDAAFQDCGMSPLFTRPPSFHNALVQNIMGGNTMVFNTAAHRLVRRAGADLDVACHDWWLYQLITGSGGRVVFDPQPSLFYRQHEKNQIGANNSHRARMVRILGLWQNRLRDWNTQNCIALKTCFDMLSPENQRVLRSFQALRQTKGITALRAFKQLQIYRQTTLGNIALKLAAMIGKI